MSPFRLPRGLDEEDGLLLGNEDGSLIAWLKLENTDQSELDGGLSVNLLCVECNWRENTRLKVDTKYLNKEEIKDLAIEKLGWLVVHNGLGIDVPTCADNYVCQEEDRE